MTWAGLCSSPFLPGIDPLAVHWAQPRRSPGAWGLFGHQQAAQGIYLSLLLVPIRRLNVIRFYGILNS
jgi:hypothetical protein